jgi:hypothetical protein
VEVKLKYMMREVMVVLEFDPRLDLHERNAALLSAGVQALGQRVTVKKEVAKRVLHARSYGKTVFFWSTSLNKFI